MLSNLRRTATPLPHWAASLVAGLVAIVAFVELPFLFFAEPSSWHLYLIGGIALALYGVVMLALPGWHLGLTAAMIVILYAVLLVRGYWPVWLMVGVLFLILALAHLGVWIARYLTRPRVVASRPALSEPVKARLTDSEALRLKGIVDEN